MEHFQIILGLARFSVNGDADKVMHQLSRLRDKLKREDPKQAEKLTRLISKEERREDFSPVSLEQMRAVDANIKKSLSGETLTKSTPLPHDKETGAPLIRIRFAKDISVEAPILSPDLEGAIGDLLSEWDRVEELRRMGVSPNTRCLLFGEPGVGKTLLANYIASKLGLPIVEARLDGLVSSFLGTTARNIGALFDFANRYRCVLFLDVFDAIAKARDDSQEIGEIKRVVNTLLQCLDARGTAGYTLAATNHHHLLDPAIWRRFDSRIEIPVPNSVIRNKIIERFLVPLKVTDTELNILSWLMDGLSASDIETLISGGKRYLAVHGGRHSKSGNGKVTKEGRSEALIAAIRRQAIVNAQLFEENKRNLLLGNVEDFAVALISALGVTQGEIAKLLGVSQSTISRLCKSSTEKD